MLTDPVHKRHKEVIGYDGGIGQFVIAPDGKVLKIMSITALPPGVFKEKYAAKFCKHRKGSLNADWKTFALYP